MRIKYLNDKKIWCVVNENNVILTYQSSYIACVNWIQSHGE
nr:MAG TPA: DNA polymerase family B [Caudoviricetes sp.]